MNNRRNRIVGWPVLFSLFSVLVIFCTILWPVFAKEKYHAMEVYLYDKKWSRHEHFPPDRKYLNVIFTGDDPIDDCKLSLADFYIRDLMNKKDTVNGINFHFAETAHYKTFVAVLDIMHMEEVPYYTVTDSNIMVFIIRRAPDKKISPVTPLYM